MQTIKILILEDDLETLSVLFKKLYELDLELAQYKDKTLSVSTLSEYTQVEEYINKNESLNFDIVLLDRDCKAGGSFHVLNIEKFGAEKIISISSTPNYNEAAKNRGVTKEVHKDYENLNTFADNVIVEIKKII